jgi:integrase
MATRRRTRTYVDNLQPKDKPYEVRDKGSGKVPGLLVRVQPSGRKYFYVRYRRPVPDKKSNESRDKPTQQCIGRSDHMTLDDARKAAGVALSAARLAVNSGLTGDNVKDQVARNLLNRDKSISEIEAEKAKRDNCPTVEKFIDERYGPWLAAKQKYAKDGRETARLKYILRLFKQDLDLLNKKVNEVGSEQIEDWLTKRRSTKSIRTGKIPASMTIQRDLVMISGVFACAIRPYKLISTNPVAEVEHKAVKNEIVRFLGSNEDDPNEEDRLLKALQDRETRKREKRKAYNAWAKERGYPQKPELAEDQYVDHLRPMVLLALDTGMRRGQLFSLIWRHVEFRKTKSGENNSTVRVPGQFTKNGKPHVVPLTDRATDVMRKWHKQSPTKFKKDAFVFPGKKGERLNDIRRAWRRVLRDVKIKDFRFNDCRHHFASQLVMNGEPLNTVRELMNHRSLQMTLRYAHLSPDHKRESVRSLEKDATKWIP